MKFQYIGGGKESPQETTAFGYVFELNGEPVEVTDAKVIKKLLGNHTFTTTEVSDAIVEMVDGEEAIAQKKKPGRKKAA